ncbi:MAG TPA: DUF4328 domain-containing protein [Pseudonocardia sp.]
MTCSRCGRAQPPEADSGPFCAHCGQFLVPTTWVASSPAGPAQPATEVESNTRYTGPPRYSSTPSWGFPALPWRPENTEADKSDPSASVRRLQAQAGLLVPLLRGLAVLATVSAAAEVWRYILLLQSRNEALSAAAVGASDALVYAASLVATATSVGVGAYLLVWVLRLIALAAERAKVAPARSRRSVLIGWLVPGINLTVPGSVFAEVEHTALGRPPGQRPMPSRLLQVWWLLWAANVVLGVLAVIWMFRTGVQARADGVELHALLDLVAAATAETTARVVGWLTALVCPARVRGRQIVIRVTEPAGGG